MQSGKVLQKNGLFDAGAVSSHKNREYALLFLKRASVRETGTVSLGEYISVRGTFPAVC